MRSSFLSLISLLAVFSPFASAMRLIQSNSLNPCVGNATNSTNNQGFSASLFNVVFTPDNRTLTFHIVGVSTISGYVTAELDVIAYGYPAISQQLNPCDDKNLEGLCPMNAGPLSLLSNYQNISADAIGKVPGIAYTIPDLDGVVQIRLFAQKTYEQLVCVQADLSNGKSVYQKAVGWVTAVIVGLSLMTAAVASGLGHSNTAAHIAANTMSLFGFFQGQALFGMSAVQLPPIVASWTQNFQWAMGIIHIGFIQDIATWYQRATGGTPSIVLSTLSTTSVDVQKRSLEAANWVKSRAAEYFPEAMTKYAKRSNNDNNNASTLKSITIHGIERVGFRADIELTNIFMTGYIFFIIFVFFVVLGVVAFKYILEALAKSGKIKNDKFQDFRNGWTTVLKGILFRIILIGFPQMVVLCFWELTVRDSGGELALAIVTVFSMIIMLAWACSKVVRLARRSITMHKNPAYILYSDPVSLHKWGFLYIQFKATAYWFVIPSLVYTLAAGLFIGLGQGSGIAQAVGLLILNAGLLIAVSILRPYMDKKTNAFNIAIAAINFVSTVFLLFFTDVFGLPGLVNGIMGVVFFIMNAAFALVLLILILIASGYAIFTKNPDVRYQPMRDDRGSFIKSQSNLTTELDALGATARGEGKSPFKRDFDDDDHSFQSHDHSGYNSVHGGYTKEGSHYSSMSYDPSPMGHDRNSMNRSQAASPWQRGAGYDR